MGINYAKLHIFFLKGVIIDCTNEFLLESITVGADWNVERDDFARVSIIADEIIPCPIVDLLDSQGLTRTHKLHGLGEACKEQRQGQDCLGQLYHIGFAFLVDFFCFLIIAENQ